MTSGEDELRVGPLWLSRNRRELRSEAGPIPIGSRAFELLSVLVDWPGRLISKHELLELVWPGVTVDENNLHVQVAALRRALGPYQNMVQTVPGRGYRFAPPPVPASEVEVTSPPAGPAAIGNLPVLLAQLEGRAVELAELQRLISGGRLITLSGTSGIGKTRLAVAVGHDARRQFPGGVWLVDLAPLTAANLVEAAAMTALGLRLPEGAALVEVIAAAVRQPALMILDNCEHLLGAAALLVEALLRHCPAISVLATSQEPLRVETEVVYRLDPLALPPRDGAGEDLIQFGAVALFVHRVAAADRRFKLTEGNGAAVAEICRQLDGIPLALEMAAARVPALGVEGLRQRLGERLRLLTRGMRTAEARHRTLRDTVLWSYELLEAGDQAVFRRLGVFAGGFSVDAAIAVTADGELDEGAVLDALGRLVDKSLVVAETNEVPRYRLLETLRLFALEQLRQSDEYTGFAERHARYFEAFFNEAYADWEVTEDAVWLARTTPELDNVRNAVEFALAGPEAAVLGVSLVGAAALLWDRLSLTEESRRYLSRAEVAITSQTPAAAAARLYRQSGNLWSTSDRSMALTLLERAKNIYEASGETLHLGAVLALIGAIRTLSGSSDDAIHILQEAQVLLDGGRGQKSIFNVLNNLGILAFIRNDFVASRTLFEKALRISRRSGARGAEAMVLINLGEIEFNLGENLAAVERVNSAVGYLRTTNRQSDLGWALVNLATYLLLDERVNEALPIAEEAILVVSPLGGLVLRACVQQWAFVFATKGHYSDAARLTGWINEGYSSNNEIRQPTEQKIYNRLLDYLDKNLSPILIQHFLKEGAAWSEDQAIDAIEIVKVKINR
jgi:predicted ATPase/DNA-binding winged helix-turn-helix (wHTH) protein